VNQIKLYISFCQVLKIYLITKRFAPIKIALVLNLRNLLFLTNTMKIENQQYTTNFEEQEKKQTYEELIQMNQLLLATFESTDNGILVVDKQGKIVFFNQKLVELWELPSEVLAGKTIQSISEFAKEKLKTNKNFFDLNSDLCQQKQIEAYSNLEFIDGRLFESYSKAQLVSGECVGIVFSFRDKTQLHQSKLLLKIMQKAVTSIHASIIITKYNSEIEYVNPFFSSLTGYSSEECIGKKMNILKSGLHSDDFYRNIYKTINKGEKWEGEICNKKKNGDLFWEFLTISPILNQKNEITHFVAVKSNISERKLNEEALENSRLQYELAIAGSNDGIWDWNLRTGEVFLSPKWKEQLGYAENELQNDYSSWENNLHPDDKAIFKAYLKDYLQGDYAHYDIEYRILTKSGNYRWMRSRGIAIKDEEGVAYRIAGSQTDITAQKQSEEQIIEAFEELKTANEHLDSQIEKYKEVVKKLNQTNDALAESETKYRLLTNLSGDIIIMHRNFKKYYVNPAIERILGYSPEEYLKFSRLELLHPEDKLKIQANYLAELHEKKNKKYTIDFRQKHKNGHYVWISAQIIINQIDASNFITIINARDISDRKNYELEIRKLSTAIIQNPSAIIITDTKGKIEYVNPQYTAISGYSPNEAIGQTPRVQKSGYHSANFYKNMWETIKRGEIWKGEINNKHKNGTFFWEFTTIAPIFNEYKEITNFVAVKTDITQLKNMENQIVQAILKTEAKERYRFAKDLHDGLSPLFSTIKLYIKAIKNSKNLDEANYFLQNLSETADSAIDTITEISNNISPHVLKNFGLVKAIQSTINQLIPANTIQVEFNFNSIDKQDIGIETTLLRIVNELIHNTLKHSKATKIKISLTQEDSLITLKYSDNGIGFDVQKANEHSTGMGLKNIRERIQSIGGKVNIDSELSYGIIIKIELDISMFNV